MRVLTWLLVVNMAGSLVVGHIDSTAPAQLLDSGRVGTLVHAHHEPDAVIGTTPLPARWWIRILEGTLFAAPGAFTGACAAFLFYRVGDFVLDRYRRKQRHHSALVRLDWLINGYHGRLRFLNKRIEQFQEAAKVGAVHRGRFRSLMIDDTSVLDLLSLDLINALFRMNERLRSVNADLEDLVDGYGEIKDAYIASQGSAEAFAVASANLANIARKTSAEMDPIKLEIEALLPEVQRMHAWIKLQAARDVPRMWIAVNTPRTARVSEHDIEEENTVLAREMEESMQSGRKRRERIHGPAKDQGQSED